MNFESKENVNTRPVRFYQVVNVIKYVFSINTSRRNDKYEEVLRGA